MTAPLAARLAALKAASAGAMNVHRWEVHDAPSGAVVRENIPGCPGYSKPVVADRCHPTIARHIAAFPPAVTRALIDAAEALASLYADDIDYITRNKLSGAENNHSMRLAREALAALDRATGGGGE